ncbi:flagellin [Haloimpatiens sp. FM7315]|uniref:flagellin N-terminal helical domain-containing protein n=1 Tax=Haloimpatiens sp. FM7315 TaxID=3298609 RepID=UPI00370C6D08
MRLMHNLAALNIYRNYSRTIETQGASIEKISSGYKINKAKEDANALAKSEKMRMQIRGLNMAQRNVQDGVSMLQTLEGGIDNLTSILIRMKELTTKYASGTNTESDKTIMQNEMDQLIKGYDDICSNTAFNEKKLLKEDKTIEIAIGTEKGEVIKFDFYNASSDNVKVNLENGRQNVTLSSLKDMDKNSIEPGEAIEIIDKSMSFLIKSRTKCGAVENKLESTMTRLESIGDKITGAESKIRDVDIAEESLSFVRDNLLVASSNAMMVQANKFPQDVLKILENVRSR